MSPARHGAFCVSAFDFLACFILDCVLIGSLDLFRHLDQLISKKTGLCAGFFPVGGAGFVFFALSRRAAPALVGAADVLAYMPPEYTKSLACARL